MTAASVIFIPAKIAILRKLYFSPKRATFRMRELFIAARGKFSVVDQELFIPDPDPALNFPSSISGYGSRQKFRIQPILFKYIWKL